MELALIDWVLIGLYLVFILLIAYRYSAQAGKSLGDFFLGGRNLPWYIAGISMVATTFAADTPLAVTELVATKGIAGNWLWWNMLIGGMLTTFFFARLWRRAGILTEVEFIDIRYGGKPARFLRGFKAIYLGLLMNVLVLGWVNLALISLLEVFFGITGPSLYLYAGLAMGITAVYSALSGLLGVALTDLVQFFIAMTGSIVLAVVVVNSEQIGGVAGLKAHLGADAAVFDFFPRIDWGNASETAGTLVITAGSFLAFIGFQWWASWYPGAEPGGGGYVAQRMMSAKNEKHAVFATLFFNVAHYCLRPWPWIIVGLCTLVLYPELSPEDAKLGYVYAMRDFLPSGLKGLLLVAFLAAYMSTVSTQLNWGASYLVNDLMKPWLKRKRFLLLGESAGSLDNEFENVGEFENVEGNENLKENSDEKETSDETNELEEKSLVGYSRLFTLILMLVALGVTTQLQSISAVWEFMFQCGAGLGMVLILRWFWWRINVWSEITATIAPFVIYGVLKFLLPALGITEESDWISFPGSYFITIAGTTLAWLLATFLTQPESSAKLESFYARVRPGGFWGAVNKGKDLSGGSAQMVLLFICWISAVVMTYSLLFAFGEIILGEMLTGLIWAGVALISGIGLVLALKRTNLFDQE